MEIEVAERERGLRERERESMLVSTIFNKGKYLT